MISFDQSNDKRKKYTAIITPAIWNAKRKDKVDSIQRVNFGSIDHEHYEDKIGFYSHLNHYDEDRRKAYRKRHSKIKLADGKPAYKKPFTPAWFSWNYLW